MIGTLYVKNGAVVSPCGVTLSTLVVRDGKILDAAYRGEIPEGSNIIDADGCYVAPGFVEIHAHGGGGSDFMDATPEAFDEVISTHMRHGTTSIMPTTEACPAESTSRMFDMYRNVQNKWYASALLGVHMEGPYLSTAMGGAQNPGWIRVPIKAEVDALMDEAGDIVRLITAAAEIEGAEYLAKQAVSRGIVMSSGHSNAVYADIARGYEWGYRHITHMYSNTPTVRKLNQRQYSGILEFAYLTDDMYVELIGDGRHVPCEVLRLAMKIKGPDRINITSDAVRPAGTNATESYLGERKPENRIIIEDNVAKLPDRSFFAGSIATGDRMLRWAVNECGASLPDAFRMMALTPATVVGAQGRKGSLEAGKNADFILLDKELNVKRVFLAGDEPFAE